ncbi:phytanoyl-CoA dioxygenase [Coccidioides immitis RS]|uniref:Phytanoyl-CoA dioxygenase n=4 Tax=Coccidioides immitis TaxID=5501 RepID=J3K7P9_COCIM|nr:phytanoyl-CoA dioxygenase [Coccidioides immitis RS]EAS30744.3 phytanoyl-CoA dioxygenase [Coccidioides immitis RS]KMP03321.1 phytanoyl-CoA dioxygenase family protein [Coccidioides immitis RMSCC 2394]KMU73863.1 phytanoyl-CoA dioxygenase family protein [Coccidioides immitis RMSCC 3703]KMU84904.1 phytanoyl-CoA dioxygenase family protein [Coccidioides immitis H538.4]
MSVPKRVTSTSSDAAPYLTALRRDGFVLIPNIIPLEQVASLRRAAAKATNLARNGQWPHIRTVPKQFPPFPTTPPPASEGGIWGVQHLLHPDMPGRSEFANLYFSPHILSVVEELVGLKGKPASDAEPLTMELFNLLVAPTCKDFALRWHRDDIPTPPTLTPEEELKQLQAKSPAERPQSHAQYNIALYPDSSLIVIPGSHLRARTQAERDADPYEENMPGQKIVALQPGDAVFYDSNIFHRGVYKGTAIPAHENEEVAGIRMTLHGSVGLVQPVEEGKKDLRATVVLQHGVGQWVNREDAKFDGLGPRAEAMRQRLIEKGTGEGVGYALDG